MTEAYPLQWPMGWPRTTKPERARFDTSLSSASHNLVYELERMGASHIVINSNMALRRDGLPYAKQSNLDDVGVAVYFMLNGEQKCIPCDRWDQVADNVQAVRKTVEALRGLERWGAKAIVGAAFSGFKALPDNIVVPDEPWFEVLEVPFDADPADIRKAFAKLAKTHHPDVGGDPKEFERIKNAYERGMS